MNVHIFPRSASHAVVAMAGITGLQQLARQAGTDLRTHSLPPVGEMQSAVALEKRLRDELEFVHFHRNALFWESVAKLLKIDATSDDMSMLILQLNTHRSYFQDVVLERNEERLPQARALCQAVGMGSEY